MLPVHCACNAPQVLRSQAAQQGPQRAHSGGNAGQAFLAQLQRGGSGGAAGQQFGEQGAQPYTATGSPSGQALLSALQRGAVAPQAAATLPQVTGFIV